MASVFGKILLITGNAEYLSERTRKRAVQAITSEQPECEVAEVVGSALAQGEMAALTSPSLFCSSSALVISDIQELGDTQQDELIAYAEQTSSDVAVVLIHSGSNKGKGLLDKLRKCPAVAEVKGEAPKYERDFSTWVRQEVRDLGATIDPNAALLLVNAVGHDLRALAGAADQLVSAIERGTPVSTEIVHQYFGGRAEVRGFEIADAAIGGRISLALEQLRWAEANKVAAVLVTSAFASGIRSLAKLASAPGGLRDADLAALIGAPPFKIKSLRGQLRDWDQAGLAKALTAVARADVEVKGGGADPAYALERMVLQVAAARSVR
ncbi:DNA polymerase III subunit delta [Aeromicrobium sp.]